jgi:tetratricopeptide (TPR) repeat protein
MRSAEFAFNALMRFGAAGVLCLAAAGCSSLVTPAKQATPAPAPAVASQAVAPAAAGKPAGAQIEAKAPAPEQKAAEPEVSAAVARAFDSAVRALAAGRLQEAERGFLALTRSNPELGGPYANLGIVYRQTGKLPEAVAALEQAVKLSPNQPAYFNQLGIVHRLHGQFDKARDAYERAITLDPSYAAPNLNLGILYDLYFWESRRALEFYDRYLALTPAGDDRVKKWVADIRNRKPQQNLVSRKEQE